MILNNFSDSVENMDCMFEMVHEVKNSIAVCRGYLDIIDCNSDGDINKYLSILRKEINRSADIISEFMSYKKTNIIKEIMDINVLIHELGDEMNEFVNNKGIMFDLVISDDEVYINGDYNKLKQVFINLIKNSIEAIDGSDGKISLLSYIKGDYCYILVRDNGSGIDDYVLFKMMNGGVTTKKNGSGIGVNFSRQIVYEHGGKIEYKSKIGMGTDVIVKLPIFMI